MKSLFFLLITSFSFGQTIQIPDVPTNDHFYRFYPNQLEIVSEKGHDIDEYRVESENCELVRDTNVISSRLVYNVVLERLNHSNVIVSVFNKKNKLVLEKVIRVSNLPDPWLYLGNAKDGDVYNKSDLNLRIDFPSGIDLISTYEIKRWTITVNFVEYTGEGAQLSDEVLEALKKESDLNKVSISCFATETNSGITRNYRATFLAN